MSNSIIQDFPTPTKDHYKVYVRSCTYNQSPYIEDCLNGVAMQKTDFPFVHHVIDDCSTDGEQDVIKAWIERECDLETVEYYDNDICTITLGKNKSNPNCTLVAYFLKRNMYRERVEKEKLYTPWREVCSYEAWCEGDDYWIDSMKLQKQVFFMDGNNDYSMCCHNSYVLRTTKASSSASLFNDRLYDYDLSIEEVINKWVVPSASILYRLDVEFDPKWLLRIYSADMRLVLALFYSGKIRFVNFIGSVYRIVKDGKSASQQNRGNIVRAQHIKLIESFDRGTDYRYHEVISASIKRRKEDMLVIDALIHKKKWVLLRNLIVVFKFVKRRFSWSISFS